MTWRWARRRSSAASSDCPFTGLAGGAERVYKLLLAWKYLRRKLAPLFAAMAVTLCTAMTVIVISVMGGFLDTLRDAARGVTGDLIVLGGLQGFPAYDGLVDALEAHPEIDAAVPVLETFGLLKILRGTDPVQVQGVDLDALEGVIAVRDTLLWDEADRRERLEGWSGVHPESMLERIRAGRLDGGGEGPGSEPLAVLGVETNPAQSRGEDGSYSFDNAMVGYGVELTVVPLTEAGGIQDLDASTRRFRVVNEFKSGLYQVDSQTVMVPFDTLQSMLEMGPPTVRVGADAFGEGGRLERRPELARTHQVVMSSPAEGADLERVRDAAQAIVDGYYAQFPDLRVAVPRVVTWRDKHGQLITAVENEKGLVTFLFGVISIVAVVMVASTFYMIVLEKTRDIGVLRAIGAARSGVAAMFLTYGLAIGLLGAVLGLALAAAVVLNLNAIQDGIAAVTGWRMWDPRTYFFDQIPARIDPAEAVWIGLGGVLSAVLGAVIPAVLAARLDPVRSLRYE